MIGPHGRNKNAHAATGLLRQAMRTLDTAVFGRSIAVFLLGFAVVALLTWICFALQLPLGAVALLYMVVIVLMAMTGDVVPSVVLALLAAVCLDYFFAEPLFSLAIKHPDDVIRIIAFVAAAFLVANLVKRARQLGEAAALRDRLQLIVDTIPAVVWSNLPDGSVEFFNQRFRDYSGPTGGEGQGSGWMNILHPEDRSALDWDAALTVGEPFEKEARLRSASGEYRRFLLRFAPLRDLQGDIVRWYASSTDIEDLKRAEEELRRQEAHLREAQAELAHANRVTTAGQLAASIAHEVAQPVAASVTNANAGLRWLRADPPNLDETHQALGRIVRDGRRASDILGRIRALVRKAPSRRDQVEVNGMITEVLALTRSELRRNQIAARIQLASGMTPVDGDRVQLQQVLLNLILNAIEAMREPSDDPKELLITSAEDPSNGVRIAIADTGPGLPTESFARVFDAFFTTKSDGMGMGLSICRSIVEAHGGGISVAANEPRGAIFQFTLPRDGASA
jgi:PAS domain S-box-containing protein